jgi:hypothetical protein
MKKIFFHQMMKKLQSTVDLKIISTFIKNPFIFVEVKNVT